MFIFGGVGLYRSTLGLELSDVLPENTAPAAFLRARERYFSFYPMFAILKGEEIDFPHAQELIEEYRLDIGKIIQHIAVHWDDCSCDGHETNWCHRGEYGT